MNKASRTRQYIIGKTAPIFNVKGYTGTSLLDITEATGLSKGSLYGNFTDKEEIAEAAFQYSMEKVREAARFQLEKVTSYKEKLIALLDFYAQYVFNSPIPGGCPLMNNAVEADDQILFMKKAVAAEMKKTIDFITMLIERGKKNGEFKAAANATELAFIFFCSIEGAIVVSRVSSSAVAMKAVVNYCKNILEQISK